MLLQLLKCLNLFNGGPPTSGRAQNATRRETHPKIKILSFKRQDLTAVAIIASGTYIIIVPSPPWHDYYISMRGVIMPLDYYHC